MKRVWIVLVFLWVPAAAQDFPKAPPANSAGQPAAKPVAAATAIQRRVEAFLRRLYAWGPSFRVKIGALTEAPVAGFYEVPVEITTGEQTDSAILYVSKDGRYLLRGDIQDMSADPLAAVRAQIRLDNSPSKGPANARVVLVEYADFQCPTCRQLHEVLRAIEPDYPQMRPTNRTPKLSGSSTTRSLIIRRSFRRKTHGRRCSTLLSRLDLIPAHSAPACQIPKQPNSSWKPSKRDNH